MSDEILSPLIGSSLRVEDKEQLDEFLSRNDARDVVRTASFEEVFFTVKHIGLADSMDLLPLVTVRQIRGFIDLDCWRKDTFVRKPLMEWIAVFIQMGAEETVRALSGIDETVIALFLKDVIQVYEVERDDPPQGTQLIFTPDNRFAVEPVEEGEPTTMGMLILDALFKYNPRQGSSILTLVRYTTRVELEETAFQNRNRRLELHGFVDYYDALSIYSGPRPGEKQGTPDRDKESESIPGEESPGNLPAVFADSLLGGQFLLKAFQHITDPEESDRFAQELTALGNRILSANLVNFGELEGIRPALEEMRDFLTIGLEYLTGSRADIAPDILRKSYIQTIFKIGFDQVARLRDTADSLATMPGFRLSTLDQPDVDFVEGLRRFKPLLNDEGKYRNFQAIADVDRARARLEELKDMVAAFMATFPQVKESLMKTFNTASVRVAVSGRFEAVPVSAKELELFLAAGFSLPDIQVPAAIQPFSGRWWKELELELTPLAGKRIDPRFIGTVEVKL
jgi:hypothetical protein